MLSCPEAAWGGGEVTARPVPLTVGKWNHVVQLLYFRLSSTKLALEFLVLFYIPCSGEAERESAVPIISLPTLCFSVVYFCLSISARGMAVRLCESIRSGWENTWAGNMCVMLRCAGAQTKPWEVRRNVPLSCWRAGLSFLHFG